MRNLIPSKDKSFPDIVSLLRTNGINFIDNRGKSGALWIIGGNELKPVVQAAGRLGVHFSFKENGSRSCGKRSCWWTTDEINPAIGLANQVMHTLKQSNNRTKAPAEDKPKEAPKKFVYRPEVPYVPNSNVLCYTSSGVGSSFCLYCGKRIVYGQACESCLQMYTRHRRHGGGFPSYDPYAKGSNRYSY